MRALRYLALLAALAFAVAGCPHPVNPPPDADAAPGPAPPPTPGPGSPSCSTWCAHAAALDCPAALPTPAGASCVDVCTNTLNGPLPFDVVCRSTASSCEAADLCEGDETAAARRRKADAGPAPPPATCAGWCQHAAALNCAAAKPTAAGAPCLDVCANAMTGPASARWNLRCRVTAKSCAAADACELGK